MKLYGALLETNVGYRRISVTKTSQAKLFLLETVKCKSRKIKTQFAILVEDAYSKLSEKFPAIRLAINTAC